MEKQKSPDTLHQGFCSSLELNLVRKGGHKKSYQYIVLYYYIKYKIQFSPIFSPHTAKSSSFLIYWGVHKRHYTSLQK